MSVTLWGYQLEHFLHLSNPLFNFKLMSDLKLPTLTKTKSKWIPTKIYPMKDVPIVSFRSKWEEINNEYNKSFSSS